MSTIRRYVVITYKDGTSINIDVPELYYQEKYKNKPKEKLHKIFMKEYDAFLRAMNTQKDMIKVSKYLTFSNASISAKNVLGIDIKEMICESLPESNTVHVPGVHDQLFLNIENTRVEELVNNLCDSTLITNVDALVKKLLSFLNKSNVEFTIKAGKKPTSNKSTTTVKSKRSTLNNVDAITDNTTQIDTTNDYNISSTVDVVMDAPVES